MAAQGQPEKLPLTILLIAAPNDQNKSTLATKKCLYNPINNIKTKCNFANRQENTVILLHTANMN